MEKIVVKCPFHRVYRNFTVPFCDNLVSGVPACVVDEFWADLDPWSFKDIGEHPFSEYDRLMDRAICSHFVRTDAWYRSFPVKPSACLFLYCSCVHPESHGFSACDKNCFVRAKVLER